jgi:hypothetical protein
MSRKHLQQLAPDEAIGGARRGDQGRIRVGPTEIGYRAAWIANRLQDTEAIEGGILGGAEAPFACEATAMISPRGFGGDDQQNGCEHE